MKRKPVKYYRIYFAVSAITVLLLLIGLLAKGLAFFGRGADRSTALTLPSPAPDLHVPKIEWLPDDTATGRRMDEYNRAEIAHEYLQSWYHRQMCYATGDTNGLKDYFTREAMGRIMDGLHNALPPGCTLQLVDLEHRLRLHYFSADGQLVAFSDEGAWLKQRIYDNNSGQRIYAGDYTSDYDVVMLLLDAHWRIKVQEKKWPAGRWRADTIARSAEGMVTITGKHFRLDGHPFTPKGVNYYPSNTPWDLFWPQYDSNVTKKDLDVIHNLGFNTFRIFIGFSDFNKGNVTAVRLSQLHNLLDLADSRHLKVIVTLFDFLGNYHLLNFPATDRQLESLLTTFHNHKAILAWDIKNEPDLDFSHNGQTEVKEWLAWTLERARAYDPNHLITIGWSNAANAMLFRDKIDFISFHSYHAPEQLNTDLDKVLSQADDKPVVLEEFGMSTYKGIWAPFGKSEKGQENYFSKIRDILHRHGDIPFLAWTLYDFKNVPSSVVGRLPWRKQPQAAFGILKENGVPKSGAAILTR
ncbi:MAG: cellulase family glycosylhydrolase [Chitinophagaceae bacterium]|nr:cellulase family glycosylhydrolase [Chitinophagaceae bacterium]